MPELNPFQKIYEKLSDREIIETIDNPRNFDPLAVEAAQSEFRKRNLSYSEIEAVRQLNAINGDEIRKIKTGASNIFKTIGNFLSPVFTKWKKIKIDFPSSYLLWAVTTFLITGVYIYSFESGFSQIKFFLFDGPDFSLEDFLPMTLPFIVFTAGVVLQLLTKRLGWFLLVLYFATTLFGYLSSILYYQFLFKNPWIDSSIESRMFTIDFLYLCVNLILIVLLTMSRFRMIYNIGQLSILFTIIGPALLIYTLWFDSLDSYAVPILMGLLLITVVWFYLITRKVKVAVVTTYPIDHNLFEEIKSEPELKLETINEEQRLTILNKLLILENKRLFKSSVRPEILGIIQNYGENKNDYIQLISAYRSIYEKDITTELMKVSSSFAAIKKNLEPFIRFGILESEYPHKRIQN